MSAKGFEKLLTVTVADGRHRAALLKGSPAAYEGFDLTSEEIHQLRAIPALTLEEFAFQASRIYYGAAYAEELRRPAAPAAAWANEVA